MTLAVTTAREPTFATTPWFTLPESLIAIDPAEARGLERDEVRMLVSFADDDTLINTRFTQLHDFLVDGDVIVVNSSATLNAALDARRANGEPIELHLSQHLWDDRWVVELRHPGDRGTKPLRNAKTGENIEIPGDGSLRLLQPYGTRAQSSADVRLWLASLSIGDEYHSYLDEHGFPIRYGCGKRRWPLSYYQTIFARTPGSAEMPSAGRPFTARVVDALTRNGVTIAPILLHTGVSSLEDNEPPYPEFFSVSETTAQIVNAARDRDSRVVAIGTTVVRSLESAADQTGKVKQSEGWTDLVITPDRELRVVDAMLTGFHEPHASHLAMLEALAGHPHIEHAYAEALRQRYLWHEFGDVHLIFRNRPVCAPSLDL